MIKKIIANKRMEEIRICKNCWYYAHDPVTDKILDDPESLNKNHYCEFLRNIHHVLKVQITAELEDRVKIVMDRDGFSRNDALLFIKTMDDARKKWCQKLYKIDLSKICQYDISLNISKFPLDEALHVICKTAMLDRSKTTPESRRALIELLCTADARTETVTDLSVSYMFHSFFDEGLNRYSEGQKEHFLGILIVFIALLLFGCCSDFKLIYPFLT